jgi:cytochrome c-type biogenesis protein CcmF
MTGLGNVLLALGAVSALVAIAAAWLGDRMGEQEGESVTNISYFATFGVLLFTTGAILVLLYAFLTNNFTFQYVAENHTTDISRLQWLYKVSGVWAGREGSLLFWEWLLAGFAAWVAYRRLQFTDRLSNVALAVTNVVQTFFLVGLFIETNNPFQAVTIAADGSMMKVIGGVQQVVGNVNQSAMNPLLQHWAMILHPPTLFIGYAGLTIPFAFAIAALILNDGGKGWVEISGRITVFSWLFLGIGIGLGAIWAYVVLGWGGYWAWDPVENASLLPWLTGVGLLHSFTVYRRREGFKAWAVVMATFSFVFVILATFITRSGVVESVHAFEKDFLSLGLFLAMMVIALLVGLGGLAMRAATFRSRDEFESLTSKEAAYYFNNVLMLVAAIIVSGLTLAPAFGGLKFSAGSYDNIARPVGILYVAILVLCPILSWRATDRETFWKRARVPVLGGLGLGAVLVAVWYLQLLPIFQRGNPAAGNMLMSLWYNGQAVAGLLVAGIAIVMPLYLFWTGASARAKSKKTSVGAALLAILGKARSQSGGYIAHLGIGVILVGLVGSSMFVEDVPGVVQTTAGQSFSAGGYTFVFNKMDEKQLANGDVLTRAIFDLKRANGASAGQVGPAELFNAVSQQATRDVAIIQEPLRDVFVVLEDSAQGKGPLKLNVKINPLISFTWAGFVLLVLGTVLAVWPKRQLASV